MANGNEASQKINLPEAFIDGGLFEIEIKELLENHWQKWFEGMTLSQVEKGETRTACTVIRGYVPDQPSLHGLLAKIRDLNLTLISVARIDPET